jgi:hypothetical protein
LLAALVARVVRRSSSRRRLWSNVRWCFGSDLRRLRIFRNNFGSDLRRLRIFHNNFGRLFCNFRRLNDSCGFYGFYGFYGLYGLYGLHGF